MVVLRKLFDEAHVHKQASPHKQMMKVALAILACLTAHISAFTTPSSPLRPATALSVDADSVNGLAGVSQDTLLAAGAAAVAGIAGAMGMKKDDSSSSSKKSAASKSEPEPIDVSIPYNAAAMMAFEEINGKNFNQKAFNEFEPLYIQKVVAEVTAKKIKRDAEQTMKNADSAVSKAAAEFESKYGKK